MKIESIETLLMKAGGPESMHHPEYQEGNASSSGLASEGKRHWLFVRIRTESGITGVGEASGWPIAQQTAIEDLKPVLIGEDASHIEAIQQRIRLAIMPHGLMGTFSGGILAAIDMALWDIKGKALGVPVWQLLGGKCRDKIPLYCHAGNASAALKAKSLGYQGIKLSGIEGIVKRAIAVREAVGDDIDMMVDLHGPPWLTRKESLRVCRQLSHLGLKFIEEPVAPEDEESMKYIRDNLDVPIAAGERLADLSQFASLISGKYIDVVQPDTGRAGGLLNMKKIAAIAESHFVNVAPHSGSLGPVAEVAAVHLLASIPNCMYLERFADDWAQRNTILDSPLVFEQGFFWVPDKPGLGIELLDEEIVKYPSGSNVRTPKDAPNERALYGKPR